MIKTILKILAIPGIIMMILGFCWIIPKIFG